MNNTQLIQGNCLDVMATIEAESINMIFADPPYNLSNGGFTVQSGKRVAVHKGDWDKSDGIDADLNFHRNWIKECQRVLAPNGTIWISGTYHSIYQCGYALQSLGFVILNDIAWFKPNAAPNIGCRCLAASHETILWAKKSKDARHIFNYETMKHYDHTSDIIKNPGKQMRSVWSIPTTPKREKDHGKHPTQKPLELLKRIILSSTNPGDIVLDPFNGSGTTGVVCKMLGRKYIGIELNSEYLELSQKRFDSTTTQLLVTDNNDQESEDVSIELF